MDHCEIGIETPCVQRGHRKCTPPAYMSLNAFNSYSCPRRDIYYGQDFRWYESLPHTAVVPYMNNKEFHLFSDL